MAIPDTGRGPAIGAVLGTLFARRAAAPDAGLRAPAAHQLEVPSPDGTRITQSKETA